MQDHNVQQLINLFFNSDDNDASLLIPSYLFTKIYEQPSLEEGLLVTLTCIRDHILNSETHRKQKSGIKLVNEIVKKFENLSESAIRIICKIYSDKVTAWYATELTIEGLVILLRDHVAELLYITVTIYELKELNKNTNENPLMSFLDAADSSDLDSVTSSNDKSYRSRISFIDNISYSPVNTTQELLTVEPNIIYNQLDSSDDPEISNNEISYSKSLLEEKQSETYLTHSDESLSSSNKTYYLVNFIMHKIFKSIHTPQCAQPLRAILYELFDIYITNYSELTKSDSYKKALITDICTQVEDEKDPRNLLLVYPLFQKLMYKYESVLENNNDILMLIGDTLFVYFPIHFKQPKNIYVNITAQELKTSLINCFFVTPIFGQILFVTLSDLLLELNNSIEDITETLELLEIAINHDIYQTRKHIHILIDYIPRLWEDIQYLTYEEPRSFSKKLVKIFCDLIYNSIFKNSNLAKINELNAAECTVYSRGINCLETIISDCFDCLETFHSKYPYYEICESIIINLSNLNIKKIRLIISDHISKLFKNSIVSSVSLMPHEHVNIDTLYRKLDLLVLLLQNGSTCIHFLDDVINLIQNATNNLNNISDEIYAKLLCIYFIVLHNENHPYKGIYLCNFFSFFSSKTLPNDQNKSWVDTYINLIQQSYKKYPDFMESIKKNPFIKTAKKCSIIFNHKKYYAIIAASIINFFISEPENNIYKKPATSNQKLFILFYLYEKMLQNKELMSQIRKRRKHIYESIDLIISEVESGETFYYVLNDYKLNLLKDPSLKDTMIGSQYMNNDSDDLSSTFSKHFSYGDNDLEYTTQNFSENDQNPKLSTDEVIFAGSKEDKSLNSSKHCDQERSKKISNKKMKKRKKKQIKKMNQDTMFGNQKNDQSSTQIVANIFAIKDTFTEYNFMEENPIKDSSLEKTSLQQPFVEEILVDESSVKKSSGEKFPRKKFFGEKSFGEKSPVDKTTVEESSVEQTPVEKTFVKVNTIEEFFEKNSQSTEDLVNGLIKTSIKEIKDAKLGGFEEQMDLKNEIIQNVSEEQINNDQNFSFNNKNDEYISETSYAALSNDLNHGEGHKNDILQLNTLKNDKNQSNRAEVENSQEMIPQSRTKSDLLVNQFEGHSLDNDLDHETHKSNLSQISLEEKLSQPNPISLMEGLSVKSLPVKETNLQESNVITSFNKISAEESFNKSTYENSPLKKDLTEQIQLSNNLKSISTNSNISVDMETLTVEAFIRKFFKANKFSNEDFELFTVDVFDKQEITTKLNLDSVSEIESIKLSHSAQVTLKSTSFDDIYEWGEKDVNSVSDKIKDLLHEYKKLSEINRGNEEEIDAKLASIKNLLIIAYKALKYSNKKISMPLSLFAVQNIESLFKISKHSLTKTSLHEDKVAPKNEASIGINSNHETRIQIHSGYKISDSKKKIENNLKSKNLGRPCSAVLVSRKDTYIQNIRRTISSFSSKDNRIFMESKYSDDNFPKASALNSMFKYKVNNIMFLPPEADVSSVFFKERSNQYNLVEYVSYDLIKHLTNELYFRVYDQVYNYLMSFQECNTDAINEDSIYLFKLHLKFLYNVLSSNLMRFSKFEDTKIANLLTYIYYVNNEEIIQLFIQILSYALKNVDLNKTIIENMVIEMNKNICDTSKTEFLCYHIINIVPHILNNYFKYNTNINSHGTDALVLLLDVLYNNNFIVSDSIYNIMALSMFKLPYEEQQNLMVLVKYHYQNYIVSKIVSNDNTSNIRYIKLISYLLYGWYCSQQMLGVDINNIIKNLFCHIEQHSTLKHEQLYTLYVLLKIKKQDVFNDIFHSEISAKKCLDIWMRNYNENYTLYDITQLFIIFRYLQDDIINDHIQKYNHNNIENIITKIFEIVHFESHNFAEQIMIDDLNGCVIHFMLRILLKSDIYRVIWNIIYIKYEQLIEYLLIQLKNNTFPVYRQYILQVFISMAKRDFPKNSSIAKTVITNLSYSLNDPHRYVRSAAVIARIHWNIYL